MKKICLFMIVFSAVISAAFPAQVTIPKTWVASETIKASDLNSNFRAIASGVNRIDASNLSPSFFLPTSKIENGVLIASHSLRHRYGGADALSGSYTIHLLAGSTCATPSTALGITNKGYVDSMIPSTASFAFHLLADTDPHSATLTQTRIHVTDYLSAPRINGTSGSGFKFNATGSEVLLGSGGYIINFSNYDIGEDAYGDFFLDNRNASPTQHISFRSSASPTLDFANTTLINYHIGSTTAIAQAPTTWPGLEPYVASYVASHTSTYTPPSIQEQEWESSSVASMPNTIHSAAVSSNFTAGWYLVCLNIQAWMDRAISNGTDVTYTLLVNGSSKYSFSVYVPAASEYTSSLNGRSDVLYLSPGDTIAVTGAIVQSRSPYYAGTKYYKLSIYRLGTGKVTP